MKAAGVVEETGWSNQVGMLDALPSSNMNKTRTGRRMQNPDSKKALLTFAVSSIDLLLGSGPCIAPSQVIGLFARNVSASQSCMS